MDNYRNILTFFQLFVFVLADTSKTHKAPLKQIEDIQFQNSKENNQKDQSFYVDALRKFFKQNSIDNNQVFRMIAHGQAYVIFDCKRPSYLNAKHELVVLENHIINYDIERRKHAEIAKSELPLYVCDEKENIWRINPDPKTGFSNPGYIGFADDKPNEADGNFIVLADEKEVENFLNKLKVFDSNSKIKASQILRLTMNVIHHPRYFKQDSQSKEIILNVKKPSNELQEPSRTTSTSRTSAKQLTTVKILKSSMNNLLNKPKGFMKNKNWAALFD